MAKASAETRTTALLFCFSAVVLVLLARAVLLQPPDRRRGGGGALADLLLAALDRFLDGRGILDLTTRRNMVLLCHAILFVILRDAGLLKAPARRRGTSTSTGAATATRAPLVAAHAAEAAACCAPVLTHAAAEPERTVVVWQRPRGGAEQDAHADGSGRRLARRRKPQRSAQQHPAAAAIARAAPVLAEQPEQLQPPLVSKEIVLVEEAPRNYLLLDDHDLDLPSAAATDRKKSGFDRRIVVAGDERNARTVTTTEEAPELADDRRFDEFIAKQRSSMRQEMQLERWSSGSRSQAIITSC